MKFAQKSLYVFSLLVLTFFLYVSLSTPEQTWAARKIVAVVLENDGTLIRNICNLNESTGGGDGCTQYVTSTSDIYLANGYCAYMTDSGDKKLIAHVVADDGSTVINNCTINESTGGGDSCVQSNRTVEDTVKDVGHFCFMDSSGNKKLVGMRIMDNGDVYRSFCDLNESTGWGDNCIEYGPINNDTSIVGIGRSTFINSSGQRKVIHVNLHDDGSWERQICDLNESTGAILNCLGSGNDTISAESVSNGYYVIPIEEEWGLSDEEPDVNDNNGGLPQTSTYNIFLPTIISFGLSGLILLSIMIIPGGNKIFSKLFFRKK